MSLPSRPVSRRRRRITRILAASCLLLGLGSCTAVLDLEQYGNAAEQMCRLIDRCYGEKDNAGCKGILEGYLRDEAPATREKWLTSFNNYDCLASCSAGRSCLNIPPLCFDLGHACARTFDCCGSLEGHTDCDTKKSTCCEAHGRPCSETERCCDGAGTCADGVCGGVACVEAGEPCSSDGQCCTKICKDDLCAKTICRPDNVDCTSDKDCCNGVCDPTRRVCALPRVCADEGQACSITKDCCDARACVVPPGATQGTCQTPTCTAAFLECATDDQCCSGRCDPTTFSCAGDCTPAAGPCDADVDCCGGNCVDHVCVSACSTGACAVNEDCCTGHCFNGFCAAPCNPIESHSGCVPGGPLAGSSDAACIAPICEADPFCCCGGWDDVCVKAFTMEDSMCANSCP